MESFPVQKKIYGFISEDVDAFGRNIIVVMSESCSLCVISPRWTANNRTYQKQKIKLQGKPSRPYGSII